MNCTRKVKKLKGFDSSLDGDIGEQRVHANMECSPADCESPVWA